MLEDETYRRIFKGICKWRLSRRADYLADAFYKSGNVQYFEKFENITSEEIFVDCGAFDGDSLRALIQYARVSKVYLYEVDVKNILIAKEKLRTYSNIEYRNLGVGAEKHIKEDRSILAICLYHNVDDLWKIPLYIRELVGDNYRFYIRHYTLYHGETVFYAVPSERIDNKN